MKRVLVFAKHDSPLIKDLIGVVKDKAWVTVTGQKKLFRTAFAGCPDGETILVFFVSDVGDMGFLEALARDFIDMKLIIYLEDPSLALRAYPLFPRRVLDARDDKTLLPSAVKGILAELTAWKGRLN